MSTTTTRRRYQVEQYEKPEIWLPQRSTIVGASDTAVLYGEGYEGQSILGTWMDKVHGPSEDDKPARLKRKRFGNIMQPAVLQLFREETGLGAFAVNNAIYRSTSMPFFGASLDALAEDDEPVELKYVSHFQGRDWEDAPPLKYQVQIQHQMAVLGASRGWLCALIGGFDLKVVPVERNDSFIASLLETVAEFWRYVELKEPPPIDGSEATRKALHRLYPQDQGTEVALPAEAFEWDAELQKAKADKKNAAERETLYANHIKAAIADATHGVLPGGGKYSWKTQHVKAEAICRPAFDKRVLLRCK